MGVREVGEDRAAKAGGAIAPAPVQQQRVEQEAVTGLHLDVYARAQIRILHSEE